MERIVAQNVYHKQHMVYRNYPTLEELAKLDELRAEESLQESGGIEASGSRSAAGNPQSSDGMEGAIVGDDDDFAEEGALEETSREEGTADKPYLQDLFEFHAPQLTQDMTVTCAEWNSHNQDLLAVSYGDTAPVPNTQGGLVLFWSLKNPIYPERVIRTRSGVTSLHFSSVHGNMVSAGMHDGSVMIWDLRRPGDQPVLRSGSSVSAHNDQKHTDIVWETRWVDRGPDKQPPELLVSVGSDGDVLQWSMKKGLERSLLMQLKRIPNPHAGANSVHGHKEGIVFRRSSGFCIDFPKDDASTYLVGTEDGLVHRCSTSYTEQYLDTFYGHSGPVYRVRCNPFMSSAFLTCSADWTMKLWTTRPMKGHQPDAPLLNFMSTDLNDAVNDVTWEPRNSTSFAAAMDDGRVELWDLSEKPLDPIVVHYPRSNKAQRRRTTVRFSTNSPVLIAGDDNGSVDVMRMYNTNQSYYSDQEQQDRLDQVMKRKR
jgi:WD40 repeat protein